MFSRIKNLFKTKKLIRDIKFYFLATKVLKKDEQKELEIKLRNNDTLKQLFQDVRVLFYPNYIKKNHTCIKVYFSESNCLIKESDSQSFYEDLFNIYCKHVNSINEKSDYRIGLYDFRILFRLYPVEEKGEFVPICNLENISQKIYQTTFNEKIPSEREEYIKYILNMGIFNTKEAIEYMIKSSEEEGFQLYGSFGVSKHYTCELDIIPYSSYKEMKIGSLNERAIKLKNEGRFDEAQSIYDYILINDPDNEVVLLNKAVLLKNLEKIGDALKIYDKVLKKDPNNFGALANKGGALAMIFEYEEAIKYYDKALRIKPDEKVILDNKKDALEALNTKKKQSKLDEIKDKGFVAYRLGEYDDAIKFYQDAHKIDPKDKNIIQSMEIAINDKAISLMERAKYDRALLILNEGLKLNPKSSSLHINIGLCYEKQELYDKAIKNYEKAIELNQKDPISYNNIGWVLFITGKYSEAIKYYDKALKINPENIRILTNKQMAFEMNSEQ